MHEDFLHYIWKHELFEKKIVADSGENIEILSTGISNGDAGPDFVNARIKIDDTVWAGNVEIHTEAKNWKMHRHNENVAYNNVILHVVAKSGSVCYRQNGQPIPTAVLIYDKNLYNNYIEIVDSKHKIPCQDELPTVNPSIVKFWLNSLCVERLESKTNQIEEALKYTNNNWEEAFYILLAKSYGFKVNALPFELMAKSTPLKVIAKYSTDLFQLEALLFGQAGLLTETQECEYYCELRKEYSYLKKLHGLNSIEGHLWKFMRLRPSNFPTIRISQFAQLIYKSKHLFSKTVEIRNINELLELYNCVAGEYWDTHYTFSNRSAFKEKRMGKAAIYGLIINTVVPFMFIYGKNRMKNDLMDKAQSFLDQILAEKNAIIRNWTEKGIQPENASESQALIQLTNSYCIPRNCLYCQIGNEIIRKKN